MVSEIRGLIQTLLKSVKGLSLISGFGSDGAVGFLSISVGRIHPRYTELAGLAGITAILSKEHGL